MDSKSQWSVLDLFSGAGGMSFGFHAHPRFRIVGAVDAEIGKPSSGMGALDCNKSYEGNIGILPKNADLGGEGTVHLEALFPTLAEERPTVLSACPPCTGFSRTNPSNHLVDDPRNSFVVRTADWAEQLKPEIVVMENARELIQGNFSHHFRAVTERLQRIGYEVHGRVHMLNDFGLPQRRERALIIAVRAGLRSRTLEDLWDGFRVRVEATHVRQAIGHLPVVEAGAQCPTDVMHTSPNISAESTRRRIELMPRDGGSWTDLRYHPEADKVLTPAMKRYIARGRFGSHPDIYGRMWWDRPAVTIKRECAHFGNGRYTHPEQDRLCTVREMAILQGFPSDYQFVSSSLGNMYRHVGDAVPPLISYQLACLCEWVLSGKRPPILECILPKTHLTPQDILEVPSMPKQAEMQFGWSAGLSA